MTEISSAFNAVQAILQINFKILGFTVNFLQIIIAISLCYLFVLIVGQVLGD